MRFHLFIVDHSACINSVLFRKSFPVPMSSMLFSTLSSIRFTVSGFTFDSLIHLELGFVQDDKYGSILFFYMQGSTLTSSIF